MCLELKASCDYLYSTKMIVKGGGSIELWWKDINIIVYNNFFLYPK
jgi:hypothetical protein